MDPEVLLEPIGEDSPSGENLEYDPVFVEMEQAAQPPEETQFDDPDEPGKEPDYGEVSAKALEILGQSHDLRAAVYLADASLNTEGLPGFANATQVIRGYLETYWDSCFPELDADDDDDPTMRINAVQGLCGQPGGMAGPSAVYRSLRRVPLTESRSFGGFSLRDIEIADGQVAAPESMANPPDSASVSAAFRDTDPDTLAATLEAAKRATENVRAISKAFDEHTPGRGPDLDPTIKLLMQMTRILSKYADSGSADQDDDDANEAAPLDDSPRAPAPGGGGGGGVGAIRSPADVSNALERIMEYYARYEPSSPIPLLLNRAKRLVSADFMTIMRDMAPDGVDNVNTISGVSDDE